MEIMASNTRMLTQNTFTHTHTHTHRKRERELGGTVPHADLC